MGRLTIELPTGLGDGNTETEAQTDRKRAVDSMTRRLVRWHECWAGCYSTG